MQQKVKSILEQEPYKFWQADLARTIGISRQRVGQIISEPNMAPLKDLLLKGRCISPARIPKNPSLTLTSVQEQIILGGLLGDASMSSISRGHHHVTFCQGFSQKDYLIFKYNFLENICPSRPKFQNNLSWSFYTYCHPVFDSIANLVLYNGHKTVNQHWLDKVTELGLAIWWMDDGSLNRSVSAIHTEGCSLQEHKLLSSWLEIRFGIRTVIQFEKPRNRYYLRLRAKDRNKLLTVIHPCIPNFPACMHYKLQPDWNIR